VGSEMCIRDSIYIYIYIYTHICAKHIQLFIFAENIKVGETEI
jgi:hypothetical protein